MELERCRLAAPDACSSKLGSELKNSELRSFMKMYDLEFPGFSGHVLSALRVGFELRWTDASEMSVALHRIVE